MDLSKLTSLGEGASLAGAVIAVGVGLLVCLRGNRILRVVLALFGLAVGFTVGLFVLGNLFEERSLVLLLGALGFGLVGAALMALLYRVGVFAFGAVAGAALAGAVGAALGVDLPTAASIGAAVLGGIVALLVQKAVIILGTAFGGAYTVVAGSLALLGIRDLPDAADLSRLPLAAGLVVLGLGILGAVTQFRAERK